ncbi:Wadjet anti-phage system protein JetD domain-containing protein [Delftia sp. GW456-R20]|uniref:Wadjet anti-phage system protein JetD domain-containing protein n=1 Tax=Delftia sp. GW456-R20 TaxID=1827145 RepID=UPI0009EF4D58|nr:Wadjet anti-phage system protein JetD domain-containing protein [Delftia sp. GW456-R20]
MKSPQQLANLLANQWQSANWREQRLLGGPCAWPLQLAIGAPDAHSFQHDGAQLREHLQQWRRIHEHGPGLVEWRSRQYRSGASPIDIPARWILQRPSDWMTSITTLRASGHTDIHADYRALASVLTEVDPMFHRLLVRRLALWRHLPAEQVVKAVQMATQLEPGCAQGMPLRALAIAGNDSKFFEHHESLLKALLDVRFEGEASRQGLASFLGASQEGEHWLLVAPLAEGLLPFKRMRITASELHDTALPAKRILLIENDRCLHQLPKPIPDTIAILGAGLNLGWLDAPWLLGCNVAYWGDMDTWGLAMLASARRHLPHLHPLLMDPASFHTHSRLAVAEPVHAETPPPDALRPDEAALDQHLRTLEKGRLEQEFLPRAAVLQAVENWLGFSMPQDLPAT